MNQVSGSAQEEENLKRALLLPKAEGSSSLHCLPQALASLRGLEGGDALLATESAQSGEGSEAEVAGGRRRLSRRAQ